MGLGVRNGGYGMFGLSFVMELEIGVDIEDGIGVKSAL
jgi:hypothetical protein